MTLLLGMGMGGVVSAQTFSSIGEVKQLTSNANVTINFQPRQARAVWGNPAGRTFSISQMGRAKLVWTLPWREKVGAGPNLFD